MVPTNVLDVNESVERIATRMRERMGDGTRLRTRLESDSGQVSLSRSQFEQIVMNLILSALDRTPANADILVSTCKAPGRVPDDGHGTGHYLSILVACGCPEIDAGATARLSRFFQEHLPIVQGLVMSAGGRLSVTNLSGSGTVFEVLLPRATPATGLGAVPDSSPLAHPKEPKTLLLVDDELTLLAMLQSFLQNGGYKALAAASAAEALATANAYEGQIDALIADISLPGTDGRDLAMVLTASRPRTKVLFISGYGARSGMGLLDEPSGASLLQKPFMPNDLLKKLNEMLQSA